MCARPATSAEYLSPPLTATGPVRFVSLPSPSWPYRLYPQQYAIPPDTRPQVRPLPAVSAVKLSPPLTATGAVRLAEFQSEVEPVVPSPSWPAELDPQQYAVPPALRPQV